MLKPFSFGTGGDGRASRYTIWDWLWMDIESFAARVHSSLYPLFYTTEIDTSQSEFSLGLWRHKYVGNAPFSAVPGFELISKLCNTGRYALFIHSLPDSVRGQETLEQVRGDVSYLMRAAWARREVGLFLVLCGAESDWRNIKRTMQPDSTGLHAVIIQAVQFVGLDSLATELNRNKAYPKIHLG